MGRNIVNAKPTLRNLAGGAPPARPVGGALCCSSSGAAGDGHTTIQSRTWREGFGTTQGPARELQALEGQVTVLVPPFGGHETHARLSAKGNDGANPRNPAGLEERRGHLKLGRTRFLKHILLAACKSKSLSLET